MNGRPFGRKRPVNSPVIEAQPKLSTGFPQKTAFKKEKRGNHWLLRGLFYPKYPF
jgi:hypothetical protein